MTIRASSRYCRLAARCLLAAILGHVGTATSAQETSDEAESADAPQTRGRVFEPAFFAQFSPRTALEMVERIPGFSISRGDGGRGLGQASENVIVNGARLSSKSESARDQLGRIPSDKVIRIEIIDGIALDIPGLTGQVANIVVDNSGLSGQFMYEGAFRTTAVDPEFYGGEISISGSTGKLDFTVALANNNNRFGATGPIVITDGNGALIEDTNVVFTGAFDVPRISGNFGYDFSDDVVGNLNVNYARSFFDRLEAETRILTGRPDGLRDNLRTGGSPEYEISGDLEFPVGSGRLKLIALEAYDADVSNSQVVDTPIDGTAPTGSRFTQTGGSGERIARAEYSWPMWGASWQVSGEAAFNRLDRVAGLFTLAPDGEFTRVDFPGGTGGVTEDRYEGNVSFSRQIASGLSVQASLGAEYSKLQQTGAAANSRTAVRPKGSASIAWQIDNGFDVSVELVREVGQLSFGDFLAEVFLDDGNADAGNNELVPEQSWGVNVEANKSLGALGSTTLSVEQRWIEDYIDVIPLSGGGESRGNIDSARRLAVDWNTTLRLDTLGIPGGQLEVEAELFESSVRDPLDGIVRPFSNVEDRELELDYRQDIPRSDIAYGASLNYSRRLPGFRLSEISREFEGPTFIGAFVEHKDVLGMTMRAAAANLFGGRERETRTVFDGPRTDGNIAFIENRNLRIGPIFRFSVSGNF
ncbi:MAG: hypothetical protein WA908_09950 [Pontixanthobacter sp.]